MIHVGGGGQYLWSMGRGKRILLGGSTVGKDIENTTKMSAARTILKLKISDGLLVLKYLRKAHNFEIPKNTHK